MSHTEKASNIKGLFSWLLAVACLTLGFSLAQSEEAADAAAAEQVLPPQPPMVSIGYGDVHITTRPHNRNLVQDPKTGNLFAFFGSVTDDKEIVFAFMP